MPELQLPSGGVNRIAKELWLPSGGVNRKQKELWAGNGSVNRKIFSGGVGYTITKVADYYDDRSTGTDEYKLVFNNDGSGRAYARIYYKGNVTAGRTLIADNIWYKITFDTPISLINGQTLISVSNATYDGQGYTNPLGLTVSTNLGIAYTKKWGKNWGGENAPDVSPLDYCKNVTVIANSTGTINYILVKYEINIHAAKGGGLGSFWLDWPAGGVTILGQPLLIVPTGQLDIQI